MASKNSNKHKGNRPGSERSVRGTESSDKDSTLRPKSSLLEREEEYKRLNAELEAKTAELVKEAEAIMTEQENFLLRSSPNQSPEQDHTSSHIRKSKADSSAPVSNLDSLSLAAKFGLFDSDEDSENDPPPRQVSVSARSVTSSSLVKRNPSAGRSRPSTASAPNSRPGSKKPASRGAKSGKPVQRKPTSAADEVDISDDLSTKLTLTETITNMELALDRDNYQSRDEDVMLAAAAEMGAEAQIRFLKANLRVMQEELGRLSQECKTGTEERKKLEVALKDANEDQMRVQKTNNTLQMQIEKHKRLLEDEKKKSDSVGAQVQSLRKELDSLKREQRQSSVSHNATEVRLNRALEDVERYKSQLQKDKQTNKESSDQDRREMDRLRADNKRLERLKNDMSTVFKKQQKLIGILKRQILHIEAAKLLSFTEEEFVKALDWGSK